MTTITPALLAEIRAKADVASSNALLYGRPHMCCVPPSALIALVAALEEAQRERDAAVKAHNDIAAELTAAQTTAGEEILKADDLRVENEKLREALNKVVHDIDDLIGNSRGVCGLHLNGDEAPWTDIIDGGRFEAWLSLDHARAALKETTNAQEG